MATRTIDASVIGAVMFAERHSASARGLMTDQWDRVAPSHLMAESLSIVFTKYLRGVCPPEDVERHVNEVLALPVRTVEDSVVAMDAMHLAVLLRHSVYDCMYLAVAMRERAPLVTADRRLYDAAVAAELGEHVVWVGDLA
jgi:predicted nucleic acid-binding protein